MNIYIEPISHFRVLLAEYHNAGIFIFSREKDMLNYLANSCGTPYFLCAHQSAMCYGDKDNIGDKAFCLKYTKKN